MKVYESLPPARELAGAAIAIGNFDGVHLGHRRLLDRSLADARARGAPAAALTFWPHPARVLAPELAPRLIASRARRRELLAEAGLDAALELPFDAAFAALPPEAFTRLLLDELGARTVVVGYDFTYGRARAGRLETLRQECAARDASLLVVEPVEVNGLVVSSTKVREFVLAGNVEGAAALLARPFDLDGPVVRGEGRGRTIGVPTANIAAEPELLPALGVYAVRVRLPSGEWVSGACNVGLNPTFRPESQAGLSAVPVSVEVHLLDRSVDLYGARLRVAFVSRLRDERRFSGVEALVAQIRADLAEARRILS
jgi:riboflavin kinase/FMN adenylyltransferase